MNRYYWVFWGLLAAIALASGGCQSVPAPSKTWKSGINLKNDIIELQVVPEIGGRVIQYKLGDYSFFWVNKDLVGCQPPPAGVGPKGEWLNYGGDKLWPAPQGWDNDQQWPGPPDAILDGSPYAAQVLTEKDKPAAVQLTSREDKRSGIQFSRLIRTFDGTTRVSVHATMKNIDTKNRRWGIWSHTQFNAGNRYGSGYNKNYWGYCPLNPNSMFVDGYNVMFGLPDNPSYKPDAENKMMQVHYQRKLGKIGLDSKAGWIATVDATDGYVFVQQFNYEPGREYPDNATVEFWMNGLGEFVAWGKVNKMPEDPQKNPYVFESEMISPYADLKPGEISSFHYDWFAAKIGSNVPVLDCGKAGVTCELLSAKLHDGKLLLNGRCGVFYKGYILLLFTDQNNRTIKEVLTGQPVGPLEPVVFSQMPKLTEGIDIPENAVDIVVFVCSAKGEAFGEIARTQISRN